MTTSFFIFLYPEPGRTKALLDMCIFLLNPREKWPAHITVAGPFPNKRRFTTLRPFKATVFGMGVFNFFRNNSPTVYLKVDFLERSEIWKKPDFVGQPIPHLTLYDGSDMEQAKAIFTMASRLNPYLSFQALGLYVVESTKGQYRADLRNAVDVRVIEDTAGMKLDEIAALDFKTRLALAEKALIAAAPKVAR